MIKYQQRHQYFSSRMLLQQISTWMLIWLKVLDIEKSTWCCIPSPPPPVPLYALYYDFDVSNIFKSGYNMQLYN